MTKTQLDPMLVERIVTEVMAQLNAGAPPSQAPQAQQVPLPGQPAPSSVAPQPQLNAGAPPVAPSPGAVPPPAQAPSGALSAPAPQGQQASPAAPATPPTPAESPLPDLTDKATKNEILLKSPALPDALARMKSKTTARIGIGRAGPRLNTRTLLTLRADHAAARDAVLADVDGAMLESLGLFTVRTLCENRNQHLTRPDLGRQFSPETLAELKAKCTMSPQVQIYASDGLSSRAVEANLADILPALEHGLSRQGLSMGTPFFVQFGRVPAMDVIAETLDAEVCCVLIGERPGLVTAESMSAYIAYRPTQGMPESRRTVVSNIHPGGTAAVEAGAYVAELIGKIIAAKTSGVDFKQ